MSVEGVYENMRRHLFGTLIGILTFAVGLTMSAGFTGSSQHIPSRYFQQVSIAPVWTEDVRCGARNFHDSAGNSVTLWSTCPWGREDWSARDEFEGEVKRYSISSRSDLRAVGYYQVDNLRGHCVIRLDEERQTSICGNSLESVLAFEQQYFSRPQ